MLKNSRGKYCFGDEITAADLFFVPHIQGGSTRFNVSLDDYPNIK
jgi:glutathione S-transferase